MLVLVLPRQRQNNSLQAVSYLNRMLGDILEAVMLGDVAPFHPISPLLRQPVFSITIEFVEIEISTGCVLSMIELLAMSGRVNITRGKLTSQSLILQGDMTKFGSANSEFCGHQLETAGAVNRHAKNPLGIEWDGRVLWSEERERRVGVRLLIVDTLWTKKDPSIAVLEGEVVGLRRL
eukprot:scaffold55435_cov73-Cyclotella_meneghiniana.AAC.2